MCFHILVNEKKTELKNSLKENHENVNNERQSATPILDAIEATMKKPFRQFHIPGHTRGKAVFAKFANLLKTYGAGLDTTDEFDSIGTLLPETGAIKEAQTIMAQTFGAKKTFFLLNGSTIGNLALGLTVLKKGSKVIVARNCHRSVVSAMMLSKSQPIWIMPEKVDNFSVWGQINPLNVEKLLDENENVSAVWLTSPTYEGVASDIKTIAKICKKKNVLLLVDEAHGCLWKFNDKFPKSALDLGASAVVHSMHKTAGSFSQSSLLHVCKNSEIDIEKLEHNLKLLHTTSPSVMLLASLDAARAFISSKKGKIAIENAIKNAEFIRKELRNFNKIKILSTCNEFNIDETKIYIQIEGISGAKVQEILKEKFKIEVESSNDDGFLILVNIGNSFEDIKYLVESLKEISLLKLEKEQEGSICLKMPFLKPEIVLNPDVAFHMETEKVKKENSIGRISAEIVAKCPPGIFVLVPGEKITENHLPYLDDYNELYVIK